MRGIVIKFNDKLGYGFIKNKDCEKDIFVHYSAIIQDGYKTLNKGDIVDFDFDNKLIKATNVQVIRKGYKYTKQ